MKKEKLEETESYESIEIQTQMIETLYKALRETAHVENKKAREISEQYKRLSVVASLARRGETFGIRDKISKEAIHNLGLCY